jgi:hypothetical protein
MSGTHEALENVFGIHEPTIPSEFSSKLLKTANPSQYGLPHICYRNSPGQYRVLGRSHSQGPEGRRPHQEVGFGKRRKDLRSSPTIARTTLPDGTI